MYTLESFDNKLQRCDKIICFGVGNYFQDFIKTYEKNVVLKKIICCIDNNPNVQGTEVEICQRKIKVHSTDVLKSIDLRNGFVLITCAKPVEMIQQIMKIREDIEYYCYSIIRNLIQEKYALSVEVPNSLRVTKVPMIPKKIHYCWFGGNPLPDRYKRWMESWYKYCPDYEIIEWNESNYDITKNQYMLQAYEAKKWGFVPDFARLDIIYEHGGIYLDTDVELLRGLDDLLFQKGFAGFECRERVNLGSGFGAEKKLPIIKRLRDYYESICFVKEDGSLNLVASPRIQTEKLVNEGLKLNGKYQIINDITILPERVLCGMSLDTRQIRNANDIISIHHYDASWVSEELKEYRRKIDQEMQRNIIY